MSPASDTGNVLATVKFGPDLFLAEKSETATITSTLSTDGIGGYDLYRVRLYAMAPNGFAEIKGAPEIYFRLSSSGVSEVDALGVGEVSFDRGSRKVFATGDVSGLDLYDISGSMIAAEPVADGDVSASTKRSLYDVNRKGAATPGNMRKTVVRSTCLDSPPERETSKASPSMAHTSPLYRHKEGDTTVPNVYEVSAGSSLMLKAVVENLGAPARCSPQSRSGGRRSRNRACLQPRHR